MPGDEAKPAALATFSSAPPRAAQDGQRGLAAVHHAEQVDADDPAPVVGGGVDEVAADRDARIVDHDLETAGRGDEVAKGALELRLLADVANARPGSPPRDHDHARGLGQRRFAQVEQSDRPAAGGELPGERAAKAAAGAGYEGTPAGQATGQAGDTG